MNDVEVTWRPGRARGWLSFAIPSLVAVCGAWTARFHDVGFALLAGAVVMACWERFDRGRSSAREIVLRDDRLHVDGQPFRLENAWLAPGWLIVRGRSGGRRDRLAIRRGELPDDAFCRLRRFCMRTLPRVNPPRVAARRLNR